MMILEFWTRQHSHTQQVGLPSLLLWVNQCVCVCVCVSGEVWDIAACPGDSSLLSTVYSGVSGEDYCGGVGVWRMVDEGEGETEGGTLDEVSLLTNEGAPKW